MQEDERLIERQKTIEINNSQQDQSQLETKRKRKKWIIIGLIVAAIVILIIVLAVTLTKKKNDPDPSPSGYKGYNQYQAALNNNRADQISGYLQFTDDQAEQKYQSLLQSPHDLSVTTKSIPRGLNNQVIRNVSFLAAMTSYKTAYLKFADANATRYEVPKSVLPNPGLDDTMRLDQIGFSVQTNPFSFQFRDTSSDNVFIDTKDQTLLMADKYIQIDFKLATQRIYGLGERVHQFGLGEGAWTMWAKGQDNFDDGMGGQNAYGVHPFALIQSKDANKFFGIYFKNSNAQSPILKHNDDGSSTLQYITIGGILEIYVFVYGSAKEIIQQYHNVIGAPTLPPFWALGWHQSSWKYNNTQMLRDVIGNYSKYEFPLETIWVDIPYLDGYSDFSINQANFSDLPAFANDLHNNNQHIVLILDGGLSALDKDNVYYKAAMDQNALIMSSQTKEPLVQKVWPEEAVFLDWFNNNASKIWAQGLQDLYTKVNYDGIWIDMNEATCFDAGEIIKKTLNNNLTLSKESVAFLKRRLEQDPNNVDGWFQSYPNQDSNSTYELPFVPGYTLDGTFMRFDNTSISLNATHVGNYTEYDVHNLFGLMMSRATYNFMTNQTQGLPVNPTLYPNTDRRPFVLSRSTFPSSGKYASHWLGDNYRSWDYLKYSIAGIMNMNMFGIPLVGADICGFIGDKRDDELCTRWIQLATFYPFARVHQNQTYLGNWTDERTEPYFLTGEAPNTAWWNNTARDAIYDRYQWLRQVYTCLFEISQWGGTCFDPLFYYYPSDNALFDNIENTFMVAGAIKVSPILEPGVNGTFQSYFPAGIWVDLLDYSVIDTTDSGKSVELKESSHVRAHLRQGTIISKQEDMGHAFKTTTDYINNVPITLIVNRDSNGQAQGNLFLDSGDSRSEIQNNQYELIKFNHQQKTIQMQLIGGNKGSQKVNIDRIIITNAKDLKDTKFTCVMTLNGDQPSGYPMTNYNDQQQTLTLKMTGIDISNIRSIMYGGDNDINMCQTPQYTIVGGAIDLSGSNATAILTPASSLLPNLTLSLKLQTYPRTIVNIKWSFNDTYAGKKLFEVPEDIVANLKDNSSTSLKLSDYVTYLNTPNFQLTVQTGPAGTKVYNIGGLFMDKYINRIWATAYTPSGDAFKGIFGLGERVNMNMFYPDGVYSMWARDVASPEETGQVPGNNMYGTHPFYAYQTDAQTWVGVFTKLAAAQDWYIKNEQQTGQVNINTIAAGGVADIYVIIEDSPKKLIQGYWQLIGSPVFTPQWALGWNQCRWGYKNTSMLREVVDQYAAHNIPLDVQWSDIDYMDSYKDFEYDPVNFAELPDFIDELHSKGMRYVPIMDAGIAKKSGYDAYDDGVKQDVFIKIGDENLIGKVWPGDAVFPDFFNDKTKGWWGSHLSKMTEKIKFDGLWQDMNEVSDFCGGVCYDSQQPKNPVKYNLKYVPTGRDLEGASMPLDAMHANGYSELDVHSLFGTMQVQASHQWFTEQNRRTFIIERSSFSGMGKYGSRWLGDNFSQTVYMGHSVLGIMMMNMFGIPLAGADICGFIGDTNAELCARWTTLGAFYPFARNHNVNGALAQEPYAFTGIYEDAVTYTEIFRHSIRVRYHMIRYYYTQLYFLSDSNMTSKNDNSLLFQPMFFEFPNDIQAYTDIVNNVMLGASLKLSIRSDAVNVNSTDFYFPPGAWCNVFNPTDPCFNTSTGVVQTLRTKAYDFYVHLREGHIVPMQDATTLNVNTTVQLQNVSVDFHVHPSLSTADKKTWTGQGLYYNDDGTVLNYTNNSNSYNVAINGNTQQNTFTFSVNTLTSAVNYANGSECTAINQNDFLGTIAVYNAFNLNLNGTYTVALTYYNAATPARTFKETATFDEATQRLIFNAPQALPVCLSTIKALTFTKKV